MLCAQRTLFGVTIQERFERFHADNPHVYKLFVQYALEAKRAGRRRYSADCIMHRVRWHVQIETVSGDSFKLNDHYTSRYARLIEAQEPELLGFFEKRELKTP